MVRRDDKNKHVPYYPDPVDYTIESMQNKIDELEHELERLRKDLNNTTHARNVVEVELERLRGVIDVLLRDGLLYPEGVKALRAALEEEADV